MHTQYDILYICIVLTDIIKNVFYGRYYKYLSDLRKSSARIYYIVSIKKSALTHFQKKNIIYYVYTKNKNQFQLQVYTRSRVYFITMRIYRISGRLGGLFLYHLFLTPKHAVCHLKVTL